MAWVPWAENNKDEGQEMKWLFFLVLCPPTGMDYCEPVWNDQLFETRVQCEQALEAAVGQHKNSDYTVMQAACRQKKEEKESGDEEKKP